MAQGGVTLDLRENFFRDEVVVSADGREVARERGVTTRTQLGLARSLHLPLGAEVARLGIAVPGLGVRGEILIPTTRPLWVGVSLTLERNGLEFRLQAEPFGYV